MTAAALLKGFWTFSVRKTSKINCGKLLSAYGNNWIYSIPW